MKTKPASPKKGAKAMKNTEDQMEKTEIKKMQLDALNLEIEIKRAHADLRLTVKTEQERKIWHENTCKLNQRLSEIEQTLLKIARDSR